MCAKQNIVDEWSCFAKRCSHRSWLCCSLYYKHTFCTNESRWVSFHRNDFHSKNDYLSRVLKHSGINAKKVTNKLRTHIKTWHSPSGRINHIWFKRGHLHSRTPITPFHSWRTQRSVLISLLAAAVDVPTRSPRVLSHSMTYPSFVARIELSFHLTNPLPSPIQLCSCWLLLVDNLEDDTTAKW